MILYDLYFIDKEGVEYPISEYLTIYKVLDAIKNDIKENGFLNNNYNGGKYRIEEFDNENPTNILRIFEIKQV